MKAFNYNGQWFTPYRKMTCSEREQPLSAVEGKLSRFADGEFESYWDLDEFQKASKTDADLYWWRGQLVMPGWDTFYILNTWL